MEGSAVGGRREAGLSEVVGFVLIIGLIVVVASLYLTYGVPAQGRENEILHMNAVKDQFVSYKISLDSLFNNNKVGTTVSNSFNLGTSGGYSTGSVGFIPVMSPLNSAGVMAINQRTAEPETLEVMSNSLVLNSTVFYREDLPAVPNFTPSHIYINISGIRQTDLNEEGVFGATVNTTKWTAIINLTPRVFYFNSFESRNVLLASCIAPNQRVSSVDGDGRVYCLFPIRASYYNYTDITLKISKGGITTLQDYSVYKNVSSGITYSVDLMNDAYGLGSAISPTDTIVLTTGKTTSGSLIAATGNITYNFADMSPYSTSPIPLGSIEYRAQNNYWIPQTFYYQMGGVFLQQGDGNTTYKLPPEITFSYDNQTDEAKKIVTVNINALTIDKNNRGVVGGNSPVQIKSTLTNITPFPYASGSANTRWIRIGVNTSDSQARTMWTNYFNYTAIVAGVPNYVVKEEGTESYILINGYDTSTTGRYDINVIASNATYSTSVHGIGGIVQ
ncbi:MAG TPA: hypothetical protein HA272_03805 [Methanoregula sp.]|nr:hypothetical protein [Methanoregula sp.]